MRGALEQRRRQFARGLGRHGVARADHRRAVHGQDLVDGGERAARASVVQQHGLVQRQYVVGRRLDGKLRFSHG